MIGQYWFSNVIIKPHYNGEGNPPTWAAKIEFYDNGWSENGSSEGEVRMRYLNTDPVYQVKTVMQDAEKLGIIRREQPTLCIYGDGEGEFGKFLPADWRTSLKYIADECGLIWPYKEA